MKEPQKKLGKKGPTKEGLNRLLEDLSRKLEYSPDYIKELRGAGEYKWATILVGDLWVKDVTDNEDTQELRRQMRHLFEKGIFDVSDVT